MEVSTPHSAGPHQSEHVVRLSFAWIMLGVTAMLLLGLAGGFLADQIFQPQLPPLDSDTERFATTIQQVTISPNQAINDMVDRTSRSVVLLGQGDATPATFIGTGFVVTNDGLIVSTTDAAGTNLTAYDQEGRVLPIELVGRDMLFGLTFFRITEGVVVPLDLRQNDSSVGQALLAMSREPVSFSAQTTTFDVAAYTMPTGSVPAAWQRLMQGVTTTNETFLGSPLVDEEGKVAGILVNPDTGTALPVSHLQASLNRVTANKREFNPFAELGFSLTFTFARPAADQAVQFVGIVNAVTANSPAAAAGLQVGDSITTIGETKLDWHRNVASALSDHPHAANKDIPLPLTILRRGQEQTISIQAPTPDANS